MRFRLVANVLALAACLPVLAQAQNPVSAAAVPREGTWELSVGAGATYLDQQLSSLVKVTSPSAGRVAPGGAVRLGYHLGTMWSLSAGAFVGYASPATVIQPFGAITWTPNVDAKTSPFVTLGGGGTSVRWQGYSANSEYGVHVGVGLLQMLGERMALRVEVREQYEKYKEATVFPNAVFNGTGTVGLSFFFGGQRVPVANVAVTPAATTLVSLGATGQLSASTVDAVGRPLSGRAVQWSSSNDSIATVTADGLVTAVAEGSATITATSEAASGTASVTVAQAAATLAVAPADTTLTALGQTLQLATTGQDANNNPIASPRVAWMSSNGAAVSVDASGLATAVRNGTATITATAAGGATASATVTVAQAIASVSVSPATASITAAGGRAQFTAQAKDANGRPVTGKVITWSGSAAGVAAVSVTGQATAVSNGTEQVTATVEGQTGSATLTVAIPVRAAPAPAPAAPAAELPAVNATVVLRNVNFRPNSAVLPPEAGADLDALAKSMQAMPTARWEIGGYTSDMGNPARNQLLSRRRAAAVRTYLIRQGVPANRLVAVGYGPQNPVASNATAAGRRQNMRVEIKRLR